MKKFFWGFAVVLSAGMFFSGCLKSKEPGCPYQDITTVTRVDSQATAIRDYLGEEGITDYIEDSAGFFYQIITPGTGTVTPTACSQVQVNYKGTFTNNTQFDASTQPVNFYLGSVIAGWQLGLKKIKSGGKMKLFIPPFLGYGSNDVKDPSTGQVVIPKMSILIFDVELLDVVQ